MAVERVLLTSNYFFLFLLYLVFFDFEVFETVGKEVCNKYFIVVQ